MTQKRSTTRILPASNYRFGVSSVKKAEDRVRFNLKTNFTTEFERARRWTVTGVL
jgi:hypothetical protein